MPARPRRRSSGTVGAHRDSAGFRVPCPTRSDTMTDPAAQPGDSILPDIQLGRRVVLRYRLPAGYPQPLTDVIGELVSLDPPTVRAADGQVVAVAVDRVV